MDSRKETVAKNLYKRGDSWRACVRVNGKKVNGKYRATLAEAEADLEALKREQRDGKVARFKAVADKDQAVLDTHAEHLAHNQSTYGGNMDKDRLSRDFVALALRGTDVTSVPGVEYSKDMHLFCDEDDLGFDAELDVEPDDAVPTLVVELKSASSLQPSNGTMKNPRVMFGGCDYSEERATIVVMLYIPSEITEATPETLRKITFWWKVALGWKVTNGEYWTTLRGGPDASNRGKPGHLLGELLCKQVHRRVVVEGGLLPYGARKRVFKSESHAKGQAVIDAIEMQVLHPQGMRFLPPVGGGEGGADDVRIAFADGTTPNAQVKQVQLVPGLAGFHVHLHRTNGSIINPDGTKKQLFKPYTQGENQHYLFGVLGVDGGLAEYWAPTETDLLGQDLADRLITDSDGNRGVLNIMVHPNVKDKYRLGDTVPNGDSSPDDLPERTRGWLRKLGPIMPLAKALVLKAEVDAARLEQRLAAKAARAQAAAPTPTPTSGKRTASLSLRTDAMSVQQRKDSDLRGFYSKC